MKFQMTRFPFFPLLPLRGGTLRVKFLLSVENAGLKLGRVVLLIKGGSKEYKGGI